MRELFRLDKRDHAACTHTYVRNSARSLILRGGRIAMVHSVKYDYYKFPGGGIEEGETPAQAMIRETREEAGLIVIPASVKEYGSVLRVQRGLKDVTRRFVQDNFYYLCAVSDEVVPQTLDRYESEEGFTLEWADPAKVIAVNRYGDHGEKASPALELELEREARVLELLIADGYFEGAL